MIRIRKMRLVSYIAVMLLLAMYVAPSAGVAKRNVRVQPPPVMSIIIFPFDEAASSPIETLSQDIANSIQSRIGLTGAYRTILYSERLPSVQRAVAEATLKKEDLKGPFGVEKAQIDGARKVAREVAADLVLIGSIDDVKVDAQKKTAQIAYEVMIVSVRTGESTMTLSGIGEAPAETQSTSEMDLIAQAAGDAVSKIVKGIAPVTILAPRVVKKRVSGFSRITRIFLPIALGLATGLIINGDSSGTSPTDNPPPVPF